MACLVPREKILDQVLNGGRGTDKDNRGAEQAPSTTVLCVMQICKDFMFLKVRRNFLQPTPNCLR